MEVGPRIFALRPQDRDIIDLFVSPDAQACCFHTGRTLYFAYPMPVDVLDILTSEELYQLHQHLDGNANLYSPPISDDWRDIRSRIIAHLSGRGYPLPQPLLLTFMRQFQYPADAPSKWAIPVLEFILGGMQGPAPYDITDFHSERVDVAMKLPNGKRISFDPKKDSLRGAIEKMNEVGELNKYLDAMDWGVPIPVYKKGRDVFRDETSMHGGAPKEVVVWYRWLEDPSSTFGGGFVPLVRNTDAGVEVGRSMYREERFLKALDEARRFFLDSNDMVLEGYGLERVRREGDTRQGRRHEGRHHESRQHKGRHHPGPSNYPKESALPNRSIPEHSVSGPERPRTKRSKSHQKVSVPSNPRHLCGFHQRQREAMEASTRLDRDLDLPPPTHAQDPHSYVINGNPYTNFRKYNPKIHHLTIKKNISDFLTKDALDRCEMIYKNFRTEHEIEEMVLLYDLPPNFQADVMEIPLSLLGYIENLRQDTIRYILSGSIVLHWEFAWCPVPALGMPTDQLSTRIRRVVNCRKERGAVGLNDYEAPEIHWNPSMERDDPESLESTQRPGSSRPAHQSQESCVQTTAGPSICEITRPTDSEGQPQPLENRPSNAGPSDTEDDSKKTEAKVQCFADQQQDELSVEEANLEDTEEQVHELHAGTPHPQSPETGTTIHVPSNTLSTADESNQPTMIHGPAADSRNDSQSDNGKHETETHSRVVPRPAALESPNASEARGNNILVSEEMNISDSHHLSQSNSDQEWSWLNGGYES